VLRADDPWCAGLERLLGVGRAQEHQLTRQLGDTGVLPVAVADGAADEVHVRVDEPGSTVSPDRSTTVAPLGMARPGPTAVIRSPCTTMMAFLTGAAPVPSIRTPARIAVIGCGCWAEML